MKVLVACEESQAVCKELRKFGHEAYNCDLQPPSGGHPEWHILQNVLELINGNCHFITMDGVDHYVEGKWDMLLAFPPCTYLTVAANRWYNVERYGQKAIERLEERRLAKLFFMKFVNADCDKIAIENPIGIMSSQYRKPDCIIHPYMFGDPERKATCLWLKGLPVLEPTNVVEPNIYKYKNRTGSSSDWHMKTLGLPKEERSKIRSKTYPGIAKAMAQQWGGEDG